MNGLCQGRVEAVIADGRDAVIQLNVEYGILADPVIGNGIAVHIRQNPVPWGHSCI